MVPEQRFRFELFFFISATNNTIRRPYYYLRKSNHFFSLSTYMNKITEVLQENKILSIIISIDNEDYLSPYLELPNVIVLHKPSHFNDIQFAVYKMLVLSRTNYFIGNRMSTFTELVFWFSKHNTKVYPVF